MKNNHLLNGLSTLLLPLSLYALPSQAAGAYQRSYLAATRGASAAMNLPGKPKAEVARDQSLPDEGRLEVMGAEPVTELVIIDGAVPDKHVFYRDMKPGTAIVEIDASKPGLTQLIEVLEDYRNLTALHIVSHAEAGTVLLGNSRITGDSLREEIAVFSTLNNALREGADVLLYGCDLAVDETETELLDIIQQNTHVDLAASNNKTGTSEHGGDWALEIVRGNIDTAVPFSKAALQDFTALLGAYHPENFCAEIKTGVGSITSLDSLFTVSRKDNEILNCDPSGLLGNPTHYSATAGAIYINASTDFELTALSTSFYCYYGYVNVNGYKDSQPVASSTNYIMYGYTTVQLENFIGKSIDRVKISTSGCSGNYIGISSFAVDITDTTPPAITSITSSDSAAADSSVPFTVHLDETVHNVSIDDFVLTATGTAAGAIASVSASSGSSVDVTVDAIAGTGSLRLDLKGNTNIQDATGNGNGSNGYVAAFTSGSTHNVDRDAPAVPTAPALAAASRSGISHSDNITNDITPTLTGTAEAAATVSIISDQSGHLGTTLADGSGHWSYTNGSALTSVTHNFTVTARDAAGNMSPVSSSLAVLIDSTPPLVTGSAPAGTPEPADTSLNFTVIFDDTVHGVSMDDFSLSSTGTAAATVAGVSSSSGRSVTVTINNISGTGSLRLDTTSAGITDAAGNLLPAFTAGNSHIVDRDAPQITSVAFDQAQVSQDNHSSLSLTLVGAEIGASASYTISSENGGTPVTRTFEVVSASQQVSNVDLSGLADGTLTISLALADAAGNVSSPAVIDTVSKDASAPAVASVAIAAGDYREGEMITLSVTLNEDVAVVGTNSTLALVIGGATRQATFASENSGTLSYTYTIQAGENTTASGLSVSANGLSLNGDTIRDAGGNDASLVFSQSANSAAQVDTLVPAIPDVLNLAGASDSGSSSSDNITRVSTPLLNGNAEANSTVMLSSNQNGVLGNAIADADGLWSFTPAMPLSEGNHRLTAVAVDAAGNNSGLSAPLDLEIDSSGPTITAATFNDAEVNGANQDIISINLRGAEVGGSATYTVSSSAGGAPVTGSLTVASTDQVISGLNVSSLADGLLTVRVVLTDVAGNTSSAVTDTISKDTDPLLHLPTNPPAIADGATMAIPGVFVSDTLSSGITVTLTAPTGTIQVEESGAAISGNGSNAVSLTGSLSQINDALAGLRFTAPANAAGPLALAIEVDDGVGNAAGSVTVTLLDRPTMEALDGKTFSYLPGSPPALLDQSSSALVSDLDSLNFNGGRLTISITAGGVVAQDLLSFSMDGPVTVGGTLQGSDVLVAGIVIGTLAHDIAEGNDLVIDLNVHATPVQAALLLRALTYENTAASATQGVRSLEITLNDGQVESTVSLEVNVYIPPPPRPSAIIVDNERDDAILTGTITVTPNGILNGGTVTGTINNRGTITGKVTLGASSIINGGIITAHLMGNPQRPAYIDNAQIDAGARLGNLVIGSNTTLSPAVQIGPNVKFENNGAIPPALDLTGALSSLNWINGDARDVVMLEGDVLTPVNGEDPMTIIRAIQLLNDFEPAGNQVNQDGLTGEILAVTRNYQAAVLPVQVYQANPHDQEGAYVNDDGDIVLVTGNHRAVLNHPVLNNRPAFTDALQSMGLQLNYNNRTNLIVSSRQGSDQAALRVSATGVEPVAAVADNFYYSGRPDVLSLPASRGSSPGMVSYPVSGLGNVSNVSILFEDTEGALLQQDIVPVPADWFALKEALGQMAGVSSVRINERGLISVTVNGQSVQGQVGYRVYPGQQIADGQMHIRLINDRSGNGERDYELVYPTGERQFLYIYPTQ